MESFDILIGDKVNLAGAKSCMFCLTMTLKTNSKIYSHAKARLVRTQILSLEMMLIAVFLVLAQQDFFLLY
jgi:phosphotransferase system IIB component